MKCVNCHREINDNMRFCPLCGHIQPKDREAYQREHSHDNEEAALSDREVLAMIEKQAAANPAFPPQMPPISGSTPPPINATTPPPIDSGNDASAMMESDNRDYESLSKEKSSKGKIFIGLGVLAVLVVAGLLFYFLSGKMGTTGSSGTDSPAVDSSAITITAEGVQFTMIRVEGGTFTMGATQEQGNDAEADEKPAHQVALSSFYIAQTEVTQELWEAVMGSNPSKNKGAKLPVENVTWDDCQRFVSKLNLITGKTFALPTEAQWEYAARGGDKSSSMKYSGSNTADDVAWHSGNSSKATHPVATKTANELDLYDMSGNVYEWCQDCYGENYYASSPSQDPACDNDSGYRVCRGGAFSVEAKNCRLSFRDSDSSNHKSESLGLRLIMKQ